MFTHLHPCHWLTVACLFFSTALQAQPPISMTYGQSRTDTLHLVSSTSTYTTPFAQPGDVLFYRVRPLSMKVNVELVAPNGAVLTLFTTGFATLTEQIYPIPVNGASGNYKIRVSNNGVWTGAFCISLERMNNSPAAEFLGCNASLNRDLECDGSIKSFRYLAQEGAYSRITVVPSLAPEVWVCKQDGTILRHTTATFSLPVVLDTIATAETECIFIFVADDEAIWDGQFSISHTLLSGDCAAVGIQSNAVNGKLCEGDTLLLTASSPLPGAVYSWVGPNGFTSSQAQVVFGHALPLHSGVYSVTVTAPNTCSSVASKTIVVNPLPMVSASVDPASGSVCAGQNFSVSVTSNATTRLWSGPNGFTSTFSTAYRYDADTSFTGDYVVEVTDSKGCRNSDTVSVAVHPLPGAAISGGPTICRWQTLLLEATTDIPNALFSWTGPAGFSSSLQTPSIPNADVTNGGYYRITVTDANTGCTSTAGKSIVVNDLPNANISGNLSLCSGEYTTLTATGGGGYLWSTGATTAGITVQPEQTTTYSVTVTNSATGCTNSKSATVEVKPLPSISIFSTPPVPEICSGTGAILLCLTTDGSNPVFSWKAPGYTSSQQCVSFSNASQSNNYIGSVKDGTTGCTNADTIPVVIHPTPGVSILQIPAGSSFCEGEDISMCANSNATGPMYNWTGPNNMQSSLLCFLINNAVPIQSGNYNVTVTDAYGCQGSGAAILQINSVPSLALTTNGNTITAHATGGTPPYLYAISPGILPPNTSGVFQNLPEGVFVITATDDKDCSASESIQVELTGVSEPAAEPEMVVFPNPSDGQVEILFKKPFSVPVQITLYNATGASVYHTTMDTGRKSVDLRHLAGGLYRMRFSGSFGGFVVLLSIVR